MQIELTKDAIHALGEKLSGYMKKRNDVAAKGDAQLDAIYGFVITYMESTLDILKIPFSVRHDEMTDEYTQLTIADEVFEI